ncbi:uncharacterized protein TNCV_3652151 [Trichonephila clavipes]|uniref:Uncharacterized protein n=1 Tax=Trichonephila clavipes TaxID=2585209 RepID=A0A8X6VFY7_TRICX|nr:uncharacterized protein TNCV_3652151 [Trichonephila clavipes]
MAQMETDPPDITNSCEERNRLSLEIEALDIVINRSTELVNFPDTDDNHEMKAILRASIDDTQRKKDTMVVLSWLSSPPRNLKPFVTNRTSEILDIIPCKQWRYVPSKENPADFGSRGMSPKDLPDCSLWWRDLNGYLVKKPGPSNQL